VNKFFAATLLESVLGVSLNDLISYSKLYAEDLKGKPGPSCVLSAFDQMLLLLLFLRFNIPDILFAVLFVQSQQTIYNSRLRTLSYLYDLVKDEIQFGTSDWRLANSVIILGDVHSFVADGSEQPVNSSSNAVLDTLFFSQKKKKHTINIVVFINIITRKIVYISQTYPVTDM